MKQRERGRDAWAKKKKEIEENGWIEKTNVKKVQQREIQVRMKNK